MLKLPSSAQIRAARGLLGWTRGQLAEKADVHANTITLIESTDDARNHAARGKVGKALEDNGIVFVDNGTSGEEGVLLRSL
jgi:DNA-binding XRE family transcriptional regulator